MDGFQLAVSRIDHPDAGRPLRAPVVVGGPFVVNTRARVDEAHADHRAGRFRPA